MANPHVGLLFLIPGLGETLRVNGVATIIADDDLLKNTSVNEKVPTVGIVVDVEECYINKLTGLLLWVLFDVLFPLIRS